MGGCQLGWSVGGGVVSLDDGLVLWVGGLVVELSAWMVRLVGRLSAWLVGWWWSTCHLGWLAGVVAVWVLSCELGW